MNYIRFELIVNALKYGYQGTEQNPKEFRFYIHSVPNVICVIKNNFYRYSENIKEKQKHFKINVYHMKDEENLK